MGTVSATNAMRLKCKQSIISNCKWLVVTSISTFTCRSKKQTENRTIFCSFPQLVYIRCHTVLQRIEWERWLQKGSSRTGRKPCAYYRTAAGQAGGSSRPIVELGRIFSPPSIKIRQHFIGSLSWQCVLVLSPLRGIQCAWQLKIVTGDQWIFPISKKS